MKKLILAGTAAMMLAGTAFAQQPPAPPAAPAETATPGKPGDPPPPPPKPGEARPHGPGPDGPGPDGRRGPPPSKAAHFRIHSGDTRIDVKCADDEPMKACADILLQVMDKLGAE